MNGTDDSNDRFRVYNERESKKSRRDTGAFSRKQLSHLIGACPEGKTQSKQNNPNFHSAKLRVSQAYFAEEAKLRKPN